MRFFMWMRQRRKAEVEEIRRRDDIEALSWDDFIAVPRTVTEVQLWLTHNQAPLDASVYIKADRSRCEDGHGR